MVLYTCCRDGMARENKVSRKQANVVKSVQPENWIKMDSA